MASERSGMTAWVSSIRLSMANDPGRQILEDQIQSGFLFLEDYLDNILVGPRHDPLIELLKTPGRKKEPKKVKAAKALKSKHTFAMNLDIEEEDSNKENEAAPSRHIDGLREALPQTKLNDSIQHGGSKVKQGLKARSLHPQVIERHSSKHNSMQTPTRQANDRGMARAPLSDLPDAMVNEDPIDTDDSAVETRMSTIASNENLSKKRVEQATHNIPTTMPLSEDSESTVPLPHDNLSAIVKVDTSYDKTKLGQSNDGTVAEIDNTQQTKQTSKKFSQSNITKKLSYNIDTMTVLDLDDFTQTTNFTSTQSFRTIPLDTPGSEKSVRDIPSTNDQSMDRAEVSAAMVRSNDGSERLSTQSNKPDADSKYQQTHNTILIPLQEEDFKHREKQVGEVPQLKPVVSQLPSIGAPSPLRKSLRAPRETQQPTAHPSGPVKPTNTRSSWLVKAREAKALEASTKHPIVAPSLVQPHHSSIGMKRKSGEMLGVEAGEGEVGRTQKLTRVAEAPPLLSLLIDQTKPSFNTLHEPTRPELASVNYMLGDLDTHLVTHEGVASEGMIDKLKKTVAGFNQRTGKSMGISLGGAAADALAARQAAEAKIAERHAAEWAGVLNANMPSDTITNTDKLVGIPSVSQQQTVDAELSTSSKSAERRFSVSELVLSEPKKDTLRERVFQPPPKSVPQTIDAPANTSVSTTPPHSPPTKHLTVFSGSEKPKPPPAQVFFPPTAGDEKRPSNYGLRPHAVSAQSSQSTFVDPIFDQDQPAWGASTQDTEVVSQEESRRSGLQVQKSEFTEPATDMDADESWHLDDKYDEVWSPVVMKDDSMTWSTAPTRSTRAGDTDRLNAASAATQPEVAVSDGRDTPEEPRSSGECDMDVEDNPNLGAIRLVTPAKTTLFSSNKEASGLTAGGFLNSATKFVTSVLGGSKKGKEPVKSIQMAAAAAKKQQEEADKKAVRMKEMELRRQQAAQKKADEERAREEKKAKEEEERYRREKDREDTTEKRALRMPGKKLAQIEEDMAKKRKLVEAEKKADSKKPPSKDKQDLSKPQKTFLAPQSILQASSGSKVLKQTALTFSQPAISKAPVQMQNSAAASTKAKLAKGKEIGHEERQAPQVQTQTKPQAERDQAKKPEMPIPAIPSEAIELPEINSEYSDSDDEDRKKTFAPPHWAQSPALREALQSQSTVDPDDIFGAIKPLKMDEIFKTRTSRFRARTSSAIWAGTDELTAFEEKQYAERMGYKK